MLEAKKSKRISSSNTQKHNVAEPTRSLEYRKPWGLPRFQLFRRMSVGIQKIRDSSKSSKDSRQMIQTIQDPRPVIQYDSRSKTRQFYSSNNLIRFKSHTQMVLYVPIQLIFKYLQTWACRWLEDWLELPLGASSRLTSRGKFRVDLQTPVSTYTNERYNYDNKRNE